MAIKDIPFWMAEPTKAPLKLRINRVPFSDRRLYLEGIKGLCVSIDDKYARNLPSIHQNALFVFQMIDSIKGTYFIAPNMALLHKTNFLSQIAANVGLRPKFTIFEGSRLSADATELLMAYGSIYVKNDCGMGGDSVYRVSKSEGVFSVQYPSGQSMAFSDVSRFILPHGIYIAEVEIPIAKTKDKETWEVRLIPPFGDKWSYGKIGKLGSHLNNGNRGAGIFTPEETLSGVVDEENARSFLSLASAASLEILKLTNSILLAIAQQVILPDDLKYPDRYPQIMSDCFSSNFLVVDLTGYLDANGRLMPAIVEAQTHGGLLHEHEEVAYRESGRLIVAKITLLQDSLKDI